MDMYIGVLRAHVGSSLSCCVTVFALDVVVAFVIVNMDTLYTAPPPFMSLFG